MAGCKDLSGSLNVDSIIVQGKQLDGAWFSNLDRFIRQDDLSFAYQSVALLRARELDAFAKSDEYERVLSRSLTYVVEGSSSEELSEKGRKQRLSCALFTPPEGIRVPS